MFNSKKQKSNQFIVAVKDPVEFEKSLFAGGVSLPFDITYYKDLFASSESKINDLKGLSKFIKNHNKDKNEVMHYWEGLIVQGYTLMEVHYEKREPALERLCSTDKIKYVCRL